MWVTCFTIIIHRNYSFSKSQPKRVARSVSGPDTTLSKDTKIVLTFYSQNKNAVWWNAARANNHWFITLVLL